MKDYELLFSRAERLYCFDVSAENVEANVDFSVFIETDVATRIFPVKLDSEDAPNKGYNLVKLGFQSFRAKKFALVGEPRMTSDNQDQPVCHIIWTPGTYETVEDPSVATCLDSITSSQTVEFQEAVEILRLACFRGARTEEEKQAYWNLMASGRLLENW